ncbi:UDP-N-acetylglucosamine 2-epimerase (non-hydrolyzing) [Epidermidibacterium keratini]|uniref:UDP-N-acetylglucosamine 2-epimerase (non-hydrolyzing) n=1 Tax=Epidermidibacterium keratini TaxID=1891644 RepID=A0A7L4YRD5_9ACTN|nr:UDP-N-acetylglucosamine 2-epimerase (non-hydrolyzing) [Epidermidibacterium keratini]QHC01474.1 UDP-N-acetylglucosamine 2-epimerase (non-hydrolyzing) [Epidermidibacterium keratini]
MSPRILTIYGTRPEAIKLAPVIKELESDSRFESVVAVTAQHREMLDQVNEVFGIIPHHDLNVYGAGQSLNSLVSKVFHGLDPVVEKVNPDAVLVQGDTSTVAAASIAAFYRQIPVVHLEAGLRSGNIQSPFPEEANRKITSQVTALHLAPTEKSRENLLAEGVESSTIVVTGNTVIDALLGAVSHPVELSADAPLAELTGSDRRIVLVTTHRRENWDVMPQIGVALRMLAERFPAVDFVFPVHRNPIVRSAILPEISGLTNVIVTEPLPYGQFAGLMNRAHFVLTDSGGIQEEAPSLGKPVLVMRHNTERPEAVAAGAVRLVGSHPWDIVERASELLTDDRVYSSMAASINPYGDGRAAQRVVAAISELFGVGTRLPDFRA